MTYLMLPLPIKIASLCLLVLLIFSPQPSQADENIVDEVGIGYGHGLDTNSWLQTDLIHNFSSKNYWPASWPESWRPDMIGIDVGLALSNWSATGSNAYHISTNALLRSAPTSTPIGTYFLEAGFGPHLISQPGKTSRLGTAFEFNSFLGLGLVLSPSWQVIARARHLSNAGITDQNGGVNLYLLQMHYQFP